LIKHLVKIKANVIWKSIFRKLELWIIRLPWKLMNKCSLMRFGQRLKLSNGSIKAGYNSQLILEKFSFC
ncbi:hypothetical protein T11_5908, partial [Trichinella zimbabwensis]